MTYCAGWKYKNSVFLLADTAATKSSAPATSHSSFGQLHAEVRGEHVEECLLKLVPIGPGTVAAIAGDVALATTCLDFLRDNFSAAPTTSGLLGFMEASLGPFDTDRAVQLLIAKSTDLGHTELLDWDTVRGLNPVVSDYYQIGSLTSYHAALTPVLLSQFVAGNLDANRMLPIAVAVVQSYGVHDNLIEMNVGGLIFGVQTATGIVSWQPDTNFVLYDPTFSTKGIITTIARDNAVVVSSSFTNDTRVFGHSTSSNGANLWTPDWLGSVRRNLDSGKTPIWIFISTVGHLITVIFRSDVHAESRYVVLSHLGDGRFDLALSPELMGLLTQPLIDRNDGSLPLRLNVRND